MNIKDTEKLTGVLELFLQSASRINEAKPQQYWYPLSMATYGVEEIVEALDSLCSFRTTMWEKTRAFEAAFAKYQGARVAVMVNSGSSADLLLCLLLRDPTKPLLTAENEVLAPVLTWPTQIWAAVTLGLQVRLVDADPQTLCIDLDDVEAKITKRTRAVFVTHLMGNVCDMDRLRAIVKAHDLLILEDCCEALGSRWNGTQVGNFGMGATFSFFFSHHMTTMEGGMVCVQDPAVADQLRIMRAHGWTRNLDDAANLATADGVDPRYTFVNWGLNLRPTDIQAGFGLRQLERLPEFEKRRAHLASRFFAFVDTVPYLHRPAVAAKAEPCWFALPVTVGEDAPFSRDEMIVYLEEQGVETRPIVGGNLARHPAGKIFDIFQAHTFPGADKVHDRAFYVGLSPLHSDKDMDRLLETMQGYVKRF